MATSLRSAALVSLLVGSALLLSSACGSSNKKKVMGVGDSGAAGETTEAGASGESANTEGGASGDSAISESGASGAQEAAAGATESEAGTAGTTSETGGSETGGSNGNGGAGMSGTANTSGTAGTSANGVGGASSAAGADGTAGTSGLAGASGTAGSSGAAGANSAAGSGGTSANSAAGSGGTAATNSTAGTSGTAGTASTACVLSGSLAGDAIFNLPDGLPSGCRGSSIRTYFSGSASDSLSCCVAFEVTPNASFPISGASNHDGGGFLDIDIPVDAPLGTQSLTLSCPGNSHDAVVNVLEVPVATSADSPIFRGSVLTITGKNLDQVSSVTLADDEVERPCPINDRSDTIIHCTPTFLGSFWVILNQINCVIPPFTDVTVTVQANP